MYVLMKTKWDMFSPAHVVCWSALYLVCSRLFQPIIELSLFLEPMRRDAACHIYLPLQYQLFFGFSPFYMREFNSCIKRVGGSATGWFPMWSVISYEQSMSYSLWFHTKHAKLKFETDGSSFQFEFFSFILHKPY